MACKYFRLDEFLFSKTAIKKKIANNPSFEIVHCLERFGLLLDRIREAYGKPIYISSGYRNEELNKAVGGVEGSGHLYGWCADLQVAGNLREFANFVKAFLDENNIKFDELLYEKSGKSEWLHFAWKGKEGRQRMKCFDIIK